MVAKVRAEGLESSGFQPWLTQVPPSGPFSTSATRVPILVAALRGEVRRAASDLGLVVAALVEYCLSDISTGAAPARYTWPPLGGQTRWAASP
jgi:hypothetical protein